MEMEKWSSIRKEEATKSVHAYVCVCVCVCVCGWRAGLAGQDGSYSGSKWVAFLPYYFVQVVTCRRRQSHLPTSQASFGSGSTMLEGSPLTHPYYL